jgi:hypothetical protein
MRYQYSEIVRNQETKHAHPQVNVQSTDLLDIGFGEVKSVALQVGKQPVMVVAFGDNGDTTLSRPSKEYLRHSWKTLFKRLTTGTIKL